MPVLTESPVKYPIQRIRGMENDNEVCLWKTSVAEIDHEVEQMRKEGVKLPDKIDHDVIIHRYKKGVEWAMDGHWNEILRDAIKG